jgi:hypothetical protein
MGSWISCLSLPEKLPLQGASSRTIHMSFLCSAFDHIDDADLRVYTPDVLRFFSTPSTILYPSLTTPTLSFSLFSFSLLSSNSAFLSPSLANRALT